MSEALTYPMVEVRLWYQSLRSSWSLDINSSLAWGKVSCESRKERNSWIRMGKRARGRKDDGEAREHLFQGSSDKGFSKVDTDIFGLKLPILFHCNFNWCKYSIKSIRSSNFEVMSSCQPVLSGGRHGQAYVQFLKEANTSLMCQQTDMYQCIKLPSGKHFFSLRWKSL